jgi:hypothetical protein
MDPPKDWWTRQYGWIAGVPWNVPVVSRPLKLTWKGRTTINALLEKDFDRLTVAHGHVIETGAREALEGAFSWLK